MLRQLQNEDYAVESDKVGSAWGFIVNGAVSIPISTSASVTNKIQLLGALSDIDRRSREAELGFYD